MMDVLVDRATSRTLKGPDMAMNTEICEIIKRDLMQAKYAVKSLKSHLKSKNPKVLLLTLTLLEAVIKNCGDVVQIHFAEKQLLLLLVKILRKKHDFQVKKKILDLINTWQKTFGDLLAQYPEYYDLQQDLLQVGGLLPESSSRTIPTFSPLHTQSQFISKKQEEPKYSVSSDFHIYSLTEIQNARDMMNALVKMVNVLDLSDKKRLEDEVLVRLVEQCRYFKQRMSHLVHTTLDKELLSLGRALNNDLQHVLAIHNDIASRISIQPEKFKSLPFLVDVDEVDSKITGNSTSLNGSTSTEITGVDPFQRLLTTSSHTDEKDVSAVEMMVDPPVDLLSWDDDDEMSTENPQVPVPTKNPTTSFAVVEKPLAIVPMNYQDILALTFFDGFSSNNTNAATDPFDLQSPNLVPQEYSPSNRIQMPLNELHSNGGALNAGAAQYGQECYVQKPKMNQIDLILNKDPKQGFNLQEPALHSGINIEQTEEVLPLPPWEIQSTEEIEPQLIIVNPQLSNLQTCHQSMQSGKEPVAAGMQVQTMMRSGYPFPSTQADLSHINHYSQMNTLSRTQLKPARIHDNLFGDLVNIAKIKNQTNLNQFN